MNSVFARAGGVGLIIGAMVSLSGCVIAVGNSTGHDDYEWRDDHDRPRMGVTLGSVDDALASQLKIDGDDSTLILGVMGGLPADKAGIKTNDVVVQVNGSDHASPSELRRAIRGAAPGGELRLRVIRAGEPLEVTVVLDQAPPTGPDN